MLGTGAGLTAFIFLIANSIKDKIDDDWVNIELLEWETTIEIIVI